MKVARALLGIVAALVVWELVLRQVVVASPGFYEHPVLGRIERPGELVFSREGYSRSRINSLGLRGPEIPPRRPGEVRILVIGDSLTQAFHVPDETTYCAQLRVALERAWQRPVTVINAGVAGTTPAQYLQLAAFYRRTLQPDHVVIQLDETDFREEAFLADKGFRAVPTPDGFRIERRAGSGRVDPMLLAVVRHLPVLEPIVHMEGLMVLSTVRTAIERLVRRLYGSRYWTPPGQNSGAHAAHYADFVKWSVPRMKAAYGDPTLLFLPDEGLPPTALERLVGATARVSGVRYLNPRRELFGAIQAHQPPRGFANTAPGVGHLNATGHRLVAERLTAHFLAERRP